MTDKRTKKQVKIFFLGLTIIAVFIGLYFAHKDNLQSSKWFFGFAMIFLTIYLIFPKLAYFIYQGWMIFAKGLAWVQTRIILVALFYLVVSPIGLAARLFGKDFLERKFNRDKKSYWNIRHKREIDKEAYLKQY